MRPGEAEAWAIREAAYRALRDSERRFMRSRVEAFVVTPEQRDAIVMSAFQYGFEVGQGEVRVFGVPVLAAPLDTWRPTGPAIVDLRGGDVMRTNPAEDVNRRGFRWGVVDVVRAGVFRGQHAVMVETDVTFLYVVASARDKRLRVYGPDGREWGPR